jgi:hypothetical protein
MVRKHQTTGAQLRTGESRDSGFALRAPRNDVQKRPRRNNSPRDETVLGFQRKIPAQARLTLTPYKVDKRHAPATPGVALDRFCRVMTTS